MKLPGTLFEVADARECIDTPQREEIIVLE
jgi:hypothetical protein